MTLLGIAEAIKKSCELDQLQPSKSDSLCAVSWRRRHPHRICLVACNLWCQHMQNTQRMLSPERSRDLSLRLPSEIQTFVCTLPAFHPCIYAFLPANLSDRADPQQLSRVKLFLQGNLALDCIAQGTTWPWRSRWDLLGDCECTGLSSFTRLEERDANIGRGNILVSQRCSLIKSWLMFWCRVSGNFFKTVSIRTPASDH